jgi:adenylate kinase
VRLALLGPPGSGKSTHGAALAHHLGVPAISVGELLRTRAGGGGLGRDVADRVARGDLVPDDVVLAVLNDALSAPAARKGHVLDGFPRTLVQAQHPDAPPIDVVVYLAVPDDVARDRLARRAASGRVDDAAPDVIERRLRRYHAETEQVLEFYRQRGMLRSVDATQPVDAVTLAILREIGVPGQ